MSIFTMNNDALWATVHALLNQAKTIADGQHESQANAILFRMTMADRGLSFPDRSK